MDERTDADPHGDADRGWLALAKVDHVHPLLLYDPRLGQRILLVPKVWETQGRRVGQHGLERTL